MSIPLIPVQDVICLCELNVNYSHVFSFTPKTFPTVLISVEIIQITLQFHNFFIRFVVFWLIHIISTITHIFGSVLQYEPFFYDRCNSFRLFRVEFLAVHHRKSSSSKVFPIYISNLSVDVYILLVSAGPCFMRFPNWRGRSR